MITISPYMLVYLMLVHWIADFCLQSRWMGENKSHKWIPFLAHIATYTVMVGLMTYPIYKTYGWWLYFVIFNGVCHSIIDSYTSRLSAHFYKAGNMGAFWKTIGADQLLHQACLLGSVGLLLK